MKLTLCDQLKPFLRVLQGALFPALQEELGPLTEKHEKLVAVLSMIRIEALIAGWSGGVGRPAKDRRSMARAFLAKAVYNMSTTRQWLERLSAGMALRWICGWESAGEIPHESKFSRAFSEFAKAQVPRGLHEALIEETQKERLIGHISLPPLGSRHGPRACGHSRDFGMRCYRRQFPSTANGWRPLLTRAI
jgi:hypothetical protein